MNFSNEYLPALPICGECFKYNRMEFLGIMNGAFTFKCGHCGHYSRYEQNGLRRKMKPLEEV